MNILFLTATSDIGGTERMLIHLLSRLDRDRFDAVVCSLVGKGTLTKKVRELGYLAENLDLRHPLQFGNMIRLYQLMKDVPFDLIQIYGLRAEVFGRPLAKMAGVPVVISSIRSPDPWRKWRHVLIDRLTLIWADCFVSNSEAGKKSRIEREKYHAGSIRVIYNGIPPPPKYKEEDKGVFRDKYGIEGKAFPVISHIANLRAMKGHWEALQSIPQLKKTFPDLRFLFAGRDDSKGEIPNLARSLGLDENVRFLGYCPEPAEILAISDAFILPSYWEGCPASLLEAMAFGLPCVASNVGGIPEIIQHGENGLLIPSKDASALSGALLSLFQNQELGKKIARNAYQTFQTRFHIDRMVREYETLYEELTDRIE
ncbi:glycosyltransferase [Candidatus Sumerlaeota bacterium]|nr:glycosyltransferase [Candidatus Sumerlaeota bacterium]